jgi:hypothetical protein
MNPIDPASNPDFAISSSTNELTRRSFMKKTALTVGAVTILGQGVGFAAGASPVACQSKQTKTNSGSEVLNRVTKWTQHISSRTGASFMLKSVGETSKVAGTSSPGTFTPSFEVSLNGKTCKYIKDSSSPALGNEPKGNWVKVDGTELSGGNTGGSLPNPAADWIANGPTTEATYSQTNPWTATQAYILSN